MGKTIKVLLTIGFLLGSAGSLRAAVATFAANASVPAATSVNIAAVKISTATPPLAPVAATALNFDPMLFDALNGYYAPAHFYAITATPAGGSGSTNTTLVYTEGTGANNPNGATNGLGNKVSATFMKVKGTEEIQLAKDALITDVGAGRTITSTQLAGGYYYKVYIGVITDPTGITNGQVFSASDAAGTYRGTVTITSTNV